MLGLSGILVALFLLIWLAYRGGSLVLLAPAAVSRKPLLAAPHNLGHSSSQPPNGDTERRRIRT